MGTIFLVLDVSIFLFGTLYFWFISKNYFYFLLIGYLLQIWSLFASFILPESPRLLIGLRRFDDARVSFRKIARCNGKKLKGWSKQDFIEAAAKEVEYKEETLNKKRSTLV